MRLAIITKNLSNPAYEAARMGADLVAARLGAITEHFVPLQPDNPMEQAELIDAALAAVPDAVVIAPVADARVEAAIARVHAAGVPITGFVNRPSSTPLVSFAGADDGQLATQIAEYLVQRMGRHGNVLLVEGPAGSPTSEARSQAFRCTLRRYPAITLVASCNGAYQRDIARDAVGSALESLSEVHGVLCANDVMALGALECLRARGRRALVVGVNAIPEAVAAISRGELLASADFNAMRMCALATECAILHLRGVAVPAELALPVQIVDVGNCNQWDCPYEQRPLPDLQATLAQAQGSNG